MPSIISRVLSNGLTVLTLPVHDVPTVAIQLWYHVGSKDEKSGQKGLAHLIEHMIFKGTDVLSESDIASITEILSGYTNAFTSHDATGYIFDTPSQHWKEFFFILANCMRNARFDNQMLNSEMKAVIQELKMYKDNYASDLVENMLSTMFADHPYHYPIIGFKQDLWGVERDTLFNFYKKHYVPNNAVLTVVGDVDPEEVFKEAEQAFGVIPKDPSYQREEFYHMRDLASTHVVMHRDVQRPIGVAAVVLPGEKAKQRYALEVFGTIVGRGRASRLYRKLVDELHIATDITFFIDRLEDVSVGFVYFEPTQESDIAMIIDLIKAEFASIAQHGVTSEELARAERTTRVAMVSRLESNYGQAKAIAQAFITTGDADYAFNYANLTTSALQHAVQKLAHDHCTASLIHTGKILPLSEADKERWVELQKISDAEDARILNGRERTLPLEDDRHALTIKPQDPKDFHFYKPEKYVLSNGIKVFQRNNSRLPKIDIVLSLQAKRYFDPEDKQGLYSFMCSMMVEGTKNYPGHMFAQTVEEYGISFQMEPGVLTMTMLKDDFEKGLELLNEILQHATFDTDEIEKVREHMIADLKMYWDTPTDFADLLMREKIYGDHPYSRNTEGTFEGLANIQREDLVGFYRTYIVPTGARLGIVGDLEGYDIPHELEKYLGSWHGQGVAPLVCPSLQELSSQTIKHTINRDQVVLVFAAHSIRRSNPDFDALLLFDQIFGAAHSMNSKLFSLREESGLFYTISGSLIAGVDEEPGMVVVKTIVSLDKLQEAKRVILKTIDTAVDELTEEELERARQMLINARVDSFATNKGMAATFIVLDRYNLGDDYFDRRVATLKGITLEQVKAAARKVLHSGRMITLEVGRV